MADVSFTKKTWADGSSGGTPITASELNRMEQGIKDCADGVNNLGDSISLITAGVAVVPASEKYPTTFHVEFGEGISIDNPAVVVTPETRAPKLVVASALNSSSDGFDLVLDRPDAVSTSVSWIAISRIL